MAIWMEHDDTKRDEQPVDGVLWFGLAPVAWFALLLGVAVVAVPASPGVALFLGAAVVNLAPGADYRVLSGQSKRLLALAVVGLGAGVSVESVVESGARGASLTLVTLVAAAFLAWLSSRFIVLRRDCGLLIATGTAICGGSAIAAAAPAIGADEEDASVALATVFLLNGVALYAFPLIAEVTSMDALRFGEWSALAIHDMSSVVGAAAAYSSQSLETAVPMKLTRALWIIPLTYALASATSGRRTRGGASAVRAGSSGAGGRTRVRVGVPWFLVGFVLMAVLFNTFEVLQPASEPIVQWSRRLLTLAIYLLGLTLSVSLIRRAGPRPMAFALAIWVPLSLFSLWLVLAF